MIIAPDDYWCSATETMCQTILADPETKIYMNCIAYHPYDNKSYMWGPDKAISSLTSMANNSVIQNSGLPLWQTEWCMNAAYGDKLRDWIDTLRLALDYVKMVYNCHVYGKSSYFQIWTATYDWGSDVDGNGIMENEGIFGPGVTHGKLNLKKYGYMLSQYTKYVRPGSKKIDTALSGVSNVFVTAYKEDNTRRFIIEFINKDKISHDVNVNLKHLQGSNKLDVIRTSDKENSVNLGKVSISSNSFTYNLPKESLTTFTSIMNS